MSATGRGEAENSLAALQAANERRTLEASGRNRKLAAAALMRLGMDCPPHWEEVATEVILHSECSWSEIGQRLGLTRHQAVSRFRSLLDAADVQITLDVDEQDSFPSRGSA